MSSSPPTLPNDDYDAIEAAVMDTARGRWFLSEFARRNRTADTSLLLTAIERLEGLLDRSEDAAPAPHEPVTTRAIASSAASELFAVEAHRDLEIFPSTHRVATGIPASGLPDDGNTTWLIEEPPSTEALHASPIATAFDDDDDLMWERPEPEPAPPPAALSLTLAAAKPLPPLQSAMLAAALAQAEEKIARAAEPEPPPAPYGTSPGPVDPSELDALSYEEKSVYFA